MDEVTVVIPAWGEPYRSTLPDAIASAVAADPGVHVLVVAPPSGQPGSVDGVSWIRCEEGSSVGAARNVGLAAVETPFVVFLDADDVLLPGALAAMRTGLDARPEAVAAIAQVRDRASGARVSPPGAVAGLARAPALLALVNACWSVLPTQGAALIRTDAARMAGGYADSSGGEDWAFGVGLTLTGPLVVVDERALAYTSTRDRAGAVPSAAEMRRRGAVARERWRQRASGAARFARAPIMLGQLLVIGILRPLRRARQGSMTTDRSG